jgi:hypothetical protein
MTDVNLSASDILEYTKKGAKLHRGFADDIELRVKDGVYKVPVSIFDTLIDQHQIKPEKSGGGQMGFTASPES